MNGKNKCKILKEIRRQIAEQNDIEYVTSECQHKGDCKGTCPKCEAEVRYLEKELEKRQKLGRTVAVAGIAVALALSSVGCDDDIPKEPSVEDTPGGIAEELQGDMALPSVLKFEELLLLKDEQRNEYISGYSRKEILSAWEEYLGNGSSNFSNRDDFYIGYDGENYIVNIYYAGEDKEADENVKAVSISIIIEPELGGDPAPD